MERLRHALLRREVKLVAVLFCDVDRLKAVNDELGHAAGDELLREVARRARAVLRPEDLLARYGGDEFVVLAEDLEHADEAVHLAERLRDAMREPMSLGRREVDASVCVGVATAPPLAAADALLAAADAAVYEAKRCGPGMVRAAQ